LLDNGLPESNIILVLMPQLVVVTPDTLKQTGGPEEVKEKGFVPSKSRFVTALLIRIILIQSTWERKLKLYKRSGCTRSEILAAFKDGPPR
jgi:hypothetical protein